MSSVQPKPSVNNSQDLQAQANYKTICEAVLDGDGEVVRQMADRIPWDLLSSGDNAANILSTCGQTKRYSDGSDAGAVALLELALEQGQQGIFRLKDVDAGGISFVEPIFHFIELGYTKPLELFLDSGFNPKTVYGTDGLSAVDVAEDNGPQVCIDLILAHMAREAAMQTMLSILSPAKP